MRTSATETSAVRHRVPLDGSLCNPGLGMQDLSKPFKPKRCQSSHNGGKNTTSLCQPEAADCKPDGIQAATAAFGSHVSSQQASAPSCKACGVLPACMRQQVASLQCVYAGSHPGIFFSQSAEGTCFGSPLMYNTGPAATLAVQLEVGGCCLRNLPLHPSFQNGRLPGW